MILDTRAVTSKSNIEMPGRSLISRMLDTVASAHAAPGWQGYVEHEVRVGAPLSYVAGKLENTLEAVHEAYRNIEAGVPDDLSHKLGWPFAPESFSAKGDGLLSPLSVALTNGLKAYMGLENVSGWSPDLWEDIVQLTHEEFHDWLIAVQSPEDLGRLKRKYEERSEREMSVNIQGASEVYFTEEGRDLMIPLQEWTCDTCHKRINAPEDGFLEWLHGGPDNRSSIYGFRIVHHSPRSPRKPNGNCYLYTDEPNRQDAHLDQFVGPDGLARLLCWVAQVPGGETQTRAQNPEELVELIRRLHIPHYEEARNLFDQARADGFLEGSAASNWFRQENLLWVINHYEGEEE